MYWKSQALLCNIDHELRLQKSMAIWASRLKIIAISANTDLGRGYNDDKGAFYNYHLPHFVHQLDCCYAFSHSKITAVSNFYSRSLVSVVLPRISGTENWPTTIKYESNNKKAVKEPDCKRFVGNKCTLICPSRFKISVCPATFKILLIDQK